MNVFLCGSHELTALDKVEIKKYLQKYAPKHNIYVLCYKSLENEVLRFYLEQEEYAKRLHLITIHPLESLPSVYQEVIEYLQSCGAHTFSFEHPEVTIYKTQYIEYLNQILDVIDLVVCMYNGDKAAAVIPVDAAKERGMEAFIYELPENDMLKARQDFESKVRVVMHE